jgi:ribonuclease Z
MKPEKQTEIKNTSLKGLPSGSTRRDVLKASGLTIGGLAMGGLNSVPQASAASNNPAVDLGEKNSYFNSLEPYYPGTEPLAPDEMRISFMGTWFAPRISQACNSIFVEVGNALGKSDYFVFDCGAGVTAKYYAMGVPLSRMNKIFLTHLHGDHMSDLTYIYCFGPSSDRKAPLYVWGPNESGLTYTDPENNTIGPFDDGTAAFCQTLRSAARWHSESFSFQTTAFTDDYISQNGLAPAWNCPNAVPSAPPAGKDSYDLVSFELDWKKEGLDPQGNPIEDNVAYYNPESGVKITHFPAVHDRQGSISYKLEWNGLSMIFTGDTKPNNYLVRQATNGVDVLIHETTTATEVWVEKFTGLKPGDPGYKMVFDDLENVQQSSHTEAKALGYVLSLLQVPPRLAVGTHYPAADDTIRGSMIDLRKWYPQGEFVISSDLMVLNVTKDTIRQRRAVVSDYTWVASDPAYFGATFDPPKYWTWGVDQQGNPVKVGDPYAQLDPNADVIDQSLWDI